LRRTRTIDSSNRTLPLGAYIASQIHKTAGSQQTHGFCQLSAHIRGAQASNGLEIRRALVWSDEIGKAGSV
jgi:hypothetical protein